METEHYTIQPTIESHKIAMKENRRLSSYQGPVVQSVVSLTSSLRVISLTVLADSIYNILIFICWKNVSSFCTAYHICVSLDVNFNQSLTNDIVSFEQLGPEVRAKQTLQAGLRWAGGPQTTIIRSQPSEIDWWRGRRSIWEPSVLWIYSPSCN